MMTKIKRYQPLAIAAMMLMSCSVATTRKTATYYKNNKTQISEIRTLYEGLYRHQPFSVGFTDRSCKYFVMEVTTDTVRYIYNTEKNQPQVYQLIDHFNYDIDLVRKLGAQMKVIKCLWISKRDFFFEERKEPITYISFKSAAKDHPFVENKYFVLLFLNKPLNSPEIRSRVRKGDWVKIDDRVYFAIGSNYR